MWTRRIPPMLGTTFVDEEAERRNAALLIAAVVAFLISGWYSYNEIRYAFKSQSVTATVTRMYEFTVPTRYGQSRPRLGIEYTFTDAEGGTRADKDWVPLPTNLRGVPAVSVQYLPSEVGDSRLEANRSVIGPVVFLACIAFVAISLVRLVREAHAPIPRRRRNR